MQIAEWWDFLSFYFYPLLFFFFFSCFNSITKSARKVSPKTQLLTQDSDTTRSKKEILILSLCLGWRLLRFSFCVFLFVFFFFSRVFSPFVATVYVRYMNSSCNFWPVFPYICVLFTDPQISFFINFFIKNGPYGTIYTFKNYFGTVISAINFQFQENKSYPNRP